MTKITKSDEEKIKLRATWYNNTGVASFGAGAVAAGLTLVMREPTFGNVVLAAFLIVSFTALSAFLHYVGFRTLERITDERPVPRFVEEGRELLVTLKLRKRRERILEGSTSNPEEPVSKTAPEKITIQD